jgi:hypothetical protein
MASSHKLRRDVPQPIPEFLCYHRLEKFRVRRYPHLTCDAAPRRGRSSIIRLGALCIPIERRRPLGLAAGYCATSRLALHPPLQYYFDYATIRFIVGTYWMKLKTFKVGRPIMVKGMAYAPTNEQGVVFLFGRLAPRLGFHVEHVQVHLPDCTARRRGKLYRIEFEFWASHFDEHRHHPRGADIVVCWENDWESRPAKYRHLEIIDLKRHVGALPRVFVVGCKDPEDARHLNSKRKADWSVPKNAQVDDLVVMYRVGNQGACIRDIWKIVGPFKEFPKNNPEGRKPGLQAGIKLVARLAHPLTFAELVRDSSTRALGVVKKRFIGTTDITDDWAVFYKKIVTLNHAVRKPLADYLPD